MTPDEAIRIVRQKANCRTRYEGQEPFLDEVLVGEIERLRQENARSQEQCYCAEKLKQETERLTRQLARVQADVELWAVTGRHRTCMCPACEDLRDIAEAAGGE